MNQNRQREKIFRIIRALEERFGVPRLRKREKPLEVLIKTMLSQNTNDRNRDKAYASLKARFPRWEDILNSSPGEVSRAIRVGGLSHRKGKRIYDLLRWIEGRYGEITLQPICQMDFAQAWENLGGVKGIGVKTLAVVLLFACEKDIFPVDTHVHRICLRLGIVPFRATAEKAFWIMRDLVPPGKSLSLHLNMIALGREICRPRNPHCPLCPLNSECAYSLRNQLRSEV